MLLGSGQSWSGFKAGCIYLKAMFTMSVCMCVQRWCVFAVRGKGCVCVVDQVWTGCSESDVCFSCRVSMLPLLICLLSLPLALPGWGVADGGMSSHPSWLRRSRNVNRSLSRTRALETLCAIGRASTWPGQLMTCSLVMKLCRCHKRSSNWWTHSSYHCGLIAL